MFTGARSGKRNQSTSPNGAQVKHKICHLLSSVIFISNGLEFFSFFLSNVTWSYMQERLRARSLLKTPACLLVSLILLLHFMPLNWHSYFVLDILLNSMAVEVHIFSPRLCSFVFLPWWTPPPTSLFLKCLWINNLLTIGLFHQNWHFLID